LPRWFRIVAVLLVLWGAMGVWACLQQVRLGADAMGPASAYDRRLYASLPFWYDAVYAVATGAGLLGALALVRGSRLARPLFALSLAAVLVQFGYLFATTDIVAAKGAGTVLPFPAFIAGVATLQLWLAQLGTRRGWLR
jgi:hypothetical protein